MSAFTEFQLDMMNKTMVEAFAEFMADKKPESEDDKLELLAIFAREQGYSIEIEDFAMDKAASRELDKVELEIVCDDSDRCSSN